jgi:hypothetical protein
MRIIWQHKLDDTDDITESSAKTNYDGDNTINAHLFKTWRTTDVTSENIVFDLGSAVAIDSVVISNHNLTNAATIKFQMHTSDAWGAPDVDETLTWREGHIVHYFTSATKRYVRFTFADAGNSDGYIEIGRLTASSYLQIDPSSFVNFRETEIPDSIVHITPSNNIYSYNISRHREYSFQFPKSTSSMIASLITMYNAVGNYTPIYLMNYNTSTYWSIIPPIHGVITNNITKEWKQKKASYSLNFREIGGV